MSNTDENLHAPMSGQGKSSPFYVAITSLPFSILLSIFSTWLCYKVLPENAAQALVSQLQFAILGTGTIGSATGIVGMVKRGLDITDGKKQIELIKTQAQYPQTPKTVVAGGNVEVGAGGAVSEGVDAVLPPTRHDYAEEPTEDF